MSVTIHSKTNCPYCVKAKDFFKEKNIQYEEIIYNPDLETYEDLKNELVAKTNFKTFPQIFVGTNFIGGYTDLVQAHSTTKLHELLKEIGIEIEYDF